MDSSLSWETLCQVGTITHNQVSQTFVVILDTSILESWQTPPDRIHLEFLHLHLCFDWRCLFFITNWIPQLSFYRVKCTAYSYHTKGWHSTQDVSQLCKTIWRSKNHQHVKVELYKLILNSAVHFKCQRLCLTFLVL